MKPSFINIHCHTEQAFSVKVIRIVNIFPEDADLISTEGSYSIGIHPWHISPKTLERDLNSVEKNIQTQNVLALGEIGLDRLYPDFELQKEIFVRQLQIAEKYSKPVIIHCVKAIPEVISILKNEKIQVPVIFHGFNAGLQIAQQNAVKGFYMSFGKDLFNMNSNAAAVISQIPLQNIFLETDSSEFVISEIYRQAADLINIDVKNLQNTILQNFDTCFKTSFSLE